VGKVDDWLAWLMLRRCVLCNQPSGAGVVCPGCRDDLPWLGAGCVACGIPLPAAAAPGNCVRCAAGRPARVRVRAALVYEYPVDRLITGAKFHRQLHLARALGELLAFSMMETQRPPNREAPPFDLLVPVPLHRRRLAARGYNQALEIARPVGEALGLELAPRLCERVRDTAEQTGLTAVERRRNLRDAFVVTGDCAGARVAVLDDVVTTGSTAAAVAKAFRQAGAAQVEVWAVARAL
jgi:ComF family protein